MFSGVTGSRHVRVKMAGDLGSRGSFPVNNAGSGRLPGYAAFPCHQPPRSLRFDGGLSTFDEAEAKCRAQGAHLVRVKDAASLAQVQAFIAGQWRLFRRLQLYFITS